MITINLITCERFSLIKRMIRQLLLIMIILGIANPGFAQNIQFSIPDTQGTTGQEIMIPIRADHFAREDSFGGLALNVKFNSNYLQWRGINTEGTLIGGWTSTDNFILQDSETKIASASAYVSRIKPDAILTKLVFYVVAESAGSATKIEITKLDLERNDLYIVNDTVRVKVNAVPVTPVNGRFVTIESKSHIYVSPNELGYFPFNNESIVHVQLVDSKDHSGKTVTVNNLGQTPPPGAFLSNKAVSVIQVQSDLPAGSFSSKLRVIYTNNQLKSAGVRNESALVLSRYDAQKGIWERYPTTVDTNSNFISTTVDRFSYWAITDTSITFRILSINDVGGDQGKNVEIQWTGADADKSDAPLPHVARYSIFRLMTNSKYEGKFGTGDWVEVTSVTARGDSVYRVHVPTPMDSTKIKGMQYSVFRIVANTDNPLISFNTPVDSGYSVDNLSPDIPKNLRIVEIPGNLVLSWNKQDNDVAYALVYRGNTENFLLDDAHRIGKTPNLYFLDTTVVKGSTYYYQVALVDSSGNIGSPTNSQRATVTAIENVTGIPASFSISQNYPNPFNLSTSIQVGIPRSAGIDLRIYNLLGQEICVLVMKSLPAGIHTIVWDGRNKSGIVVPSGIYLYKIKAGNFTAVKKMVLVK